VLLVSDAVGSSVGPVELPDGLVLGLAVVVAVAAGHRGEAFAAGKDLIDEVKARVPIWKRQSFTDGAVAWVGIETTLDVEG